MKNSKRILAAGLAVLMSMSFAACGEKNDNSESSSKAKVEVDSTELAKKIESLPEGTVLKWMGTYDLNPTKGSDPSVAYSLFTDKGGTIEWTRVANNKKFDKLGAVVTSGKDIPDIFKYEWLAFPCQALKGFYQPIDELVDFNDDIWKDVKKTADQFSFGDIHYVAPISFSIGTMMCYNKAIIESEGLDDPMELYDSGEWDWNSFYDIVSDFKSNASGSDERYGLSGWFAPQFVQQTGQTMVVKNAETGDFESNINNAEIEKAEKFIYDISKEGLVDTVWYNSASEAFNNNRNLFYNMGIWAMTGAAAGPTSSDNWGIVPVPSCPNVEGSYMTSDMLAYMWVKGSDNAAAVKCWFECERVATFDQEYQKTAKEKFLSDNPNWTEEMYDIYKEASSDKFVQIFDYGYGISQAISVDRDEGRGPISDLYEGVTKTDENGQQFTYTQLKEKYSALIDSELKTINDQIKKFLSTQNNS